MEKMTCNEIIAFIQNAMDSNLDIQTDIFKNDIRITIFNKDKEVYIKYFDKLYITINNLNYISVENISKIEDANLKLIFAKAEEYSNNKVIEHIRNFFTEDNKLTTINDLDDNE